MSWFDSVGLTNFAKSALSTAQKTIDKALDITEDNVSVESSISNTVSVPDAENFFEAFGLGAKASRNVNKNVKKQVKEEPSTSSHEKPQNFWTDTWGSFFEADKSLSDLGSDIKKESDEPSFPQTSQAPSVTTSESAVSSQPVRSSLFPGNVSSEDKSSKSLTASGDTITNVLPCVVTSDIQSPSLVAVNDEPQLISDLPSSTLRDDETNIENDSLKNKLFNEAVKEKEYDLTNENVDCETPKSNEYDVVDVNEKCLEGTFINQVSCLSAESLTISKESLIESEPNNKESIDLCNNQYTVPSINIDSQETINFSDSFHILNSCVIHTVNNWENSRLEDSVHESESTEEANSRNGDTQSNSSKDESETDVIKECDLKSSGSAGSHEMSGSFVKCSLEDAECGSHRGQSPLSTATSDQSDGTKLESEQNTSGDEIETTTSSDIEILSAPNGENGDRNSQNWIPRILRTNRSESPPSDCSKDSLVTHHQSEVPPHVNQRHHRKAFEGMDIKRLIKQQDELQVVLEAREKKIMELTQENLKLHENFEIIQNELSESKTSQDKNSEAMSSMTKEFTQRLAQMEGQLLKVSKERDSLRNMLEESQNELVQRIRISEMDDIIKEKDQQIKELMEEGEKLSKKELTHTTIIKKLRAKEEDMEHTIKSLKEKLDENSKEVERLRKSLGAKDEQEKKHIDAIRQMTATINKQEKEITQFKSQLEDSAEKELSHKKSLEGTYMELTELQRTIEAKDLEIQKLNLSMEMAAKEKLRESVDQANKEKETLLFQIEDLRRSLTQAEEQSNKMEISLKEDIARLQLRLQESEDRNEKLTQNISAATRPVVRQIEILQASYNAQVTASEKIEKNLTDRLNDLQSRLNLCSERERLTNEKCSKMTSELTKLETENATLRQENFKLTSEIDTLNSQLAHLEENTNRELQSVNKVKETFMIEINKLKEEKDKVLQELQKTLEQLNDSRQQIQTLQEDIKIKESRLQSVGNMSHNSSPSHSLRSSVDSLNNWIPEAISERRLSTSRISVYDSLRNGCTASVLENLQSQLKQREGEIAQLQCEIIKLEREREIITQELVAISTQNETLKENLQNFIGLKKSHGELEISYTKLLEMYGEIVEKNSDLTEEKSMYKAQIEELLKNK